LSYASIDFARSPKPTPLSTKDMTWCSVPASQRGSIFPLLHRLSPGNSGPDSANCTRHSRLCPERVHKHRNGTPAHSGTTTPVPRQHLGHVPLQDDRTPDLSERVLSNPECRKPSESSIPSIRGTRKRKLLSPKGISYTNVGISHNPGRGSLDIRGVTPGTFFAWGQR